MKSERQVKARKDTEGDGGLARIRTVLARTVIEWFQDGVPRLGAALAFYTIFSAAPISIIVIAIGGSIYGPEIIERGLLARIEGVVGRRAAEFIGTMIQSASPSQSGFAATMLGLITIFLGATAVFVELQAALNKVWNVSVEVHRGPLVAPAKETVLVSNGRTRGSPVPANAGSELGSRCRTGVPERLAPRLDADFLCASRRCRSPSWSVVCCLL
jgi:hypothetical protein